MASGISGPGRSELARLLGRGRQFVSVSDAADELGLDHDAAAKKLARWAEQGWLRRVRRNLYIPVPVDAERPESWGADPLLLADAVWHPAYATGWTAASHWGLTEQVFNTTVIKTAQRVRTTKHRLLDSDFLVSHTSEASLAWGLHREWRDGLAVAIADPARTVVDILDEPRLAGGVRLAAEILSAYLEERDPETLIQYGDKAGNRTVFKRLGYLGENLDADPSLLAACEDRLSSGFPLLDPTQPRRGDRSSRWRLTVNVNLEEFETS
jgi:predicted transcriptional regulator of viral defense system